MNTLFRLSLACLAVLWLSSPAFAQDACQTAIAPFQVTSGAPFTVSWVMDSTVALSATDPTPVPQRIDGHYLQIDNGPRLELLIAPGLPCPTGTPMAGKLPYVFRSASGVSRGAHTATVTPWNYALDAAGLPTTFRQEGPAVSAPFAGVDPVQFGPPAGPSNLGIKK
jgi:hypothetical protein